MKTAKCGLLLLLGCFAIVGPLHAQTPPDNKTQVGRCQLLYAELENDNETGSPTYTKTVLRIDTVTGQTWKYSSVSIQGATDEGWVLIKEPKATK